MSCSGVTARCTSIPDKHKGEKKDNDLHLKSAVKSMGCDMEITLNYLSIWQEKQGLFNTIAPISSWCFSWKLVWTQSYIGTEDRCMVQVTLASLYQHHHILTHQDLSVMAGARRDGLNCKSKGLGNLHKGGCILHELSITAKIMTSLLVWCALYFQIVNQD